MLWSGRFSFTCSIIDKTAIDTTLNFRFNINETPLGILEPVTVKPKGSLITLLSEELSVSVSVKRVVRNE